MAPKLCDVCSRVPAWLGSKPWDDVYYRHDPPITLRSFVDMRAEAEKGPGSCHLCQLIYTAADRNEGWRPIEGQRSDFAWVNTPFVMRRHWDQYKKKYEFYCENMSRLFVGEISAAPMTWQPRFSPLLGFKERTKHFNVKLMKDWLDNCLHNHPNCQPAFRDFLPTRLLDVEAFNSNKSGGKPPYNLGNDIRLVSSDLAGDIPCEGLLPPSYLTLSHCWGPPEKRPMITTKMTLAKRMERIPFVDLPRTFQDAVDVTRQLGQRYLWIDSLCIVQDDEEDWGREAGLMAKVYSQAYCTLAALSANDSTEGLRMVEDVQGNLGPFIDLMAPIPSGGNGCGGGNAGSSDSFQVRIWAYGPEHWQIAYMGKGRTFQDPESSPLAQRAWTLQERALSRRSIFFGQQQLLWECREHHGTAELPWFSKADNDRLKVDSQEGYWGLADWEEWQELKRTQSELAATVARSREKAKRWWDLVVNYADRLLTKQTDRLAALSGVAQLFQDDFPNATYVAGLWSSHLPEALLWNVGWQNPDYTPCRASEYVAPSWSWASVAGPVSLMHYAESPVEEFRKRFTTQRTKEEKMCGELKVEEINVLHKYDDPYGPLKGANLVLSGARLVDVELITEPFDEPDPIYRGLKRDGLKRDGFKVADYHTDVAGEAEQSTGRLRCLAMRVMEEWKEKPTIGGLLLREEGFDGSLFTYSRLGTFVWMPFSLFDGMEPRRIKLI